MVVQPHIEGCRGSDLSQYRIFRVLKIVEGIPYGDILCQEIAGPDVDPAIGGDGEASEGDLSPGDIDEGVVFIKLICLGMIDVPVVGHGENGLLGTLSL
jgi:hypothetical protein